MSRIFLQTNAVTSIFYEFLTDVIMEVLMKPYFSVKVGEKDTEVSLDNDEKNALRYTTNYYVMKTKLQQMANFIKKELQPSQKIMLVFVDWM